MPLLLLDRDGVINHDSKNYIRSLTDWRPIEGSYAAIAKASKAGFKVAVVTNQSGLARGYFDKAALAEMHENLIAEVARLGGTIDAIYYCPHGPDDGCDCRKPAPGMVLNALHDFAMSPDEALLVGDSLRDLQAAEAAGVASVLVRTGNGEKTAKSDELPTGSTIAPDLETAIASLLASNGCECPA